MRKSTFTEEQIAYALRETESGTSVLEVCRKLGVSEQTFYRWKRKFAGMGVAELRRLRQLEDENRRLKQLVADLTLDRHMLARGDQKKAGKPTQQKPLVDFVRVGFVVSERRACRIIGCDRKTYRYKSRAKDQTALRMRLRELASVRVRYGYRRRHILLRREGGHVNHKRVYRLYRLEGLCVCPKVHKKRASALRPLLPAAQAPNEQWSM